MEKKFEVKIGVVNDRLETLKEIKDCLFINVVNGSTQKCCCLDFSDENEKVVFSVKLTDPTQVYQMSSNNILFRSNGTDAVVKVGNQQDAVWLIETIQSILNERETKQSVFSQRTDETSAKQYFTLFSYLSQQQTMLQDSPRTDAYHNAMLQNLPDFQDKVVLDVGAGSGILSLFAVQAGAKRVYAVEASNMALHCQSLIEGNKLTDKIIMKQGKIEEVDIPENVDVLISDLMGYMLFHERTLESYIHARKWLKPNGKMFPTQALFYTAPFSDETLYMEQYTKASFWFQPQFKGVDVSPLKDAAMDEYFSQPVKGRIDVGILMAKSDSYNIEFLTDSEQSLHLINIPFHCTLYSSGTIHGLAFWFDVLFIGSQKTICLSTAPSAPWTDWFQVRCLFKKPVVGLCGQEVSGTVVMKANKKMSYDVDIEMKVVGTDQVCQGSYDLKNPYFHNLSPPPVKLSESNPTEAFYSTENSTTASPTKYAFGEQVTTIGLPNIAVK